VTSAADAERQAAIVWAIAEAELHEWIYQAFEPWHSVEPRRDPTAATAANTAGGQLRAALASSRPVFGVFARNSISGELLDLARQVDLGFVVLDLEHGPTPPEREFSLLAELAHLRGVALLVRIAAPEAHLAAKAMDLGACGVVIPNCETWEQAKAVVDACYLPPAGTRGYSPTSTRARLLSGTNPHKDPTGDTNSQTVVVIQVESPSLAAELPTVVADDRVNALLLGLHDLEVRDPRPAAEWAEVARQAVRAKPQVAWGQVVDPKAIEAAIRLGARFLPLSSDSALLKQGLTDRLSNARNLEGSI
jgi:4-hydroxy-2-oxoheptanedioate aldolase